MQFFTSSETLQNVILLTHKDGIKSWKKYFAKLKLREQATKAKDHFYTVWPRKAFDQLGRN